MPAEDFKHRAKRFNEGVKLVATLFNALAIITVGTAFIGPIAQRRYDVLADGGWTLLSAAAVLHLMSHLTLRFLRAEE